MGHINHPIKLKRPYTVQKTCSPVSDVPAPSLLGLTSDVTKNSKDIEILKYYNVLKLYRFWRVYVTHHDVRSYVFIMCSLIFIFLT